jgi:hypothetical protein
VLYDVTNNNNTTNATGGASSSINKEEIAQLRAEMLVFFEHLSRLLDEIQRLLQQQQD